ncbi:MAG: hypothetical protein V4462_15285 [Pseudomonadota bacterium]
MAVSDRWGAVGGALFERDGGVEDGVDVGAALDRAVVGHAVAQRRAVAGVGRALGHHDVVGLRRGGLHGGVGEHRAGAPEAAGHRGQRHLGRGEVAQHAPGAFGGVVGGGGEQRAGLVAGEGVVAVQVGVGADGVGAGDVAALAAAEGGGGGVGGQVGQAGQLRSLAEGPGAEVGRGVAVGVGAGVDLVVGLLLLHDGQVGRHAAQVRRRQRRQRDDLEVRRQRLHGLGVQPALAVGDDVDLLALQRGEVGADVGQQLGGVGRHRAVAAGAGAQREAGVEHAARVERGQHAGRRAVLPGAGVGRDAVLQHVGRCRRELDRDPVDRHAPEFAAVGRVDVDAQLVVLAELELLDRHHQRVVGPGVVEALQRLLEAAVEADPVDLRRDARDGGLVVDVEDREAQRGLGRQHAVGDQLGGVLQGAVGVELLGIDQHRQRHVDAQRAAAAKGAAGVEAGAAVGDVGAELLVGRREGRAGLRQRRRGAQGGGQDEQQNG